MKNLVIEAQKKRLEFLRALYEAAKGSTNKYIESHGLGRDIGILDLEEISNVVSYLYDEGLIDGDFAAGENANAFVKLSHSGLQEIESFFAEPDVPTEHFQPMNILYVNQMIGSSIQQGTMNSTQNSTITFEFKEKLDNFLNLVDSKIEEIEAADELKSDILSELETIRAQNKSSKPKQSIIYSCLESLKNIFEGSIGGAIGTQLANYIPPLLAILASSF
ncbi:MAG: hypothetical protein EOO52_08315 [Gammaproteobacteria bacterium]|nr:MAG: hypothetical protein EOO52_08315 [Gammaproteobacteria bacterium]